MKVVMDRAGPCPTCGSEPGAEDRVRGRATADWAAAWGHRCPHGEPCPAGADHGDRAVCRECVPTPRAVEAGSTRWLGGRAPAPSEPPPEDEEDEDEAEDDEDEDEDEDAGDEPEPEVEKEEAVRKVRSDVERYEWDGQQLTIAELAVIADTSPSNLRQRLRRGWPLKNAISGEVPEGKRKPKARASKRPAPPPFGARRSDRGAARG